MARAFWPLNLLCIFVQFEKKKCCLSVVLKIELVGLLQTALEVCVGASEKGPVVIFQTLGLTQKREIAVQHTYTFSPVRIDGTDFMRLQEVL